VFPPRKGGKLGKGDPSTFDPDPYRRRKAVGRCAEMLKGCCSIAARHEALVSSFAVLRQHFRTLWPSHKVWQQRTWSPNAGTGDSAWDRRRRKAAPPDAQV
jgi:hypothetical protein